MKKIFIIAGILLTAGLILLGAGCGMQSTENSDITKEEQASVPEQADNTNQESVEINPGVTKEELESLKIDLEEMEYEDLSEIKK